MPKSLFDIIGPIMAGPSSSHTAGAAKLGGLARRFVKGDIASVVFYLHGSFAKTYKGHGTDKALLGGIMGLPASSPELRFAFDLAKQSKIDYKFVEADLGDVHPNSVKIEVVSSDGKTTVISGASVGGGAVKITAINGIKMSLSGDYPAIVTHHVDRRGILSVISRFLAENGLNVATVNLFRSEKGKDAFMIIESDDDFDDAIAEELKREVQDMIDVFIIK